MWSDLRDLDGQQRENAVMRLDSKFGEQEAQMREWYGENMYSRQGR